MNMTLASVARGAEGKEFIRRSYVGNPPGYLHREKNLCRAYAAECLAESYLRNGTPQKRHGQRVFTYASVGGWEQTSGGRKWKTWAKHWGVFLRAGGDGHLGKWLSKAEVWGEWEPGDMVFWLAGTSGYTCKYGHVAPIVEVRADGTVIVSENSSSRGIGTHSISRQALAKLAGVMRWTDPQVQEPEEDEAPGLALKVQLLGVPGHKHVQALLLDETYVPLRPFMRLLGVYDDYDIHPHIPDEQKVYLKKRGGS